MKARQNLENIYVITHLSAGGKGFAKRTGPILDAIDDILIKWYSKILGTIGQFELRCEIHNSIVYATREVIINELSHEKPVEVKNLNFKQVFCAKISFVAEKKLLIDFEHSIREALTLLDKKLTPKFHADIIEIVTNREIEEKPNDKIGDLLQF